jgi:hypothetical protein
MGVGRRHAPPPYPLERAPVPIVLEAGWAPGWTRTSMEKREPLASSGVRFSDRPVRNESIYRLRHRLKYYTGISRTGLWKTTKILSWWFVFGFICSCWKFVVRDTVHVWKNREIVVKEQCKCHNLWRMEVCYVVGRNEWRGRRNFGMGSENIN